MWRFLLLVFFKGFNFEPYVRNGYIDLMQKAINFNDVAIFFLKTGDYRIHFWYMNKGDAISIIKNSDLNERCELL